MTTRTGGGRRRDGRRFYPRRKVCSFCVDKIEAISYKDSQRLRRYVSDWGKIESRRKTGTCAPHQRMLATAIKRARYVALLPYTGSHSQMDLSFRDGPRADRFRKERERREAERAAPRPETPAAAAEAPTADAPTAEVAADAVAGAPAADTSTAEVAADAAADAPEAEAVVEDAAEKSEPAEEADETVAATGEKAES